LPKAGATEARAPVASTGGGDRERDLDLVRATIELGHTMGLRVVAECVEDKATLDLLSGGCDLAQGYFISRPLPAEKLRLLPGETPPSLSAETSPLHPAAPRALPGTAPLAPVVA
jgi:EAL domain